MLLSFSILISLYGIINSDVVNIKNKSWREWIKSTEYCSNSWELTQSGKSANFKTCVPISDTTQNILITQNCTLKTLLYDATGLNLIYFNISTETRTCFSQIVRHPKCRENFTVNYSFKKNVDDPDQFTFLTLLPILPVDHSSIFHKRTEIVPVKLNGRNYISFAFQAEYYCGTINSFNIFYYKCSSASNELVNFVSTNAPAEGHIKINGKCATNSVQALDSVSPYLECKSDGTETIFGRCLCNLGYYKVAQKCVACTSIKYKDTIGNEPCKTCGQHSTSFSVGLVSCVCAPGYYRAVEEVNNSSKPCYKLPPFISGEIVANDLTSTSVNITWSSDFNELDFDNFLIKSEIGNAIREQTNQSFIMLDGLSAATGYNITISIINSITKKTQRTNARPFYFETLLGVLPAVINIEKRVNEDGSVRLSWEVPSDFVKSNVNYVIKYDGKSFTRTDTSIVIKPSSEDQTFKVEIYIEVKENGKVYKGTSSYIDVSIPGGVSLMIVVIIVVSIIVLLIVAFIVVFYVWKRRHPAYLQVVRMEDGTVKLPNRLLNLSAGKKLYVDPTTYNAVDDAVQEFANEIFRHNLHIGQLLGGGEFAEVYKGTLLWNDKRIDVAIKTLRSSATKKDRDDFFGEAAILGQFNDPNVISLEGVILKDHPNLIVLEFMTNGALDKYLQENDTKFTVLQLLGMARGVASGMKYLSELSYIHRDLAARNILVDNRQICKVSDFGMSRELKVDETYDTQGGKIPVRWTAPESIQFRKFTTASDVWSYGVLLWEIMSYGERPYWDWGNYEVVERINAGYRLPPPMSCPKVLHNLMLTCWNKDRAKRPKFQNIRDTCEKWIRSPELLEEIASVVTKTDENLDYTVLQTIYKWLTAIGMDKYTSNFVDQGFATPRQILDLTEEDLEALGIGPIGHRKKIYKAIKNTKLQVEIRHSSFSSRKKLASTSQKK